MGYLAGVPWLAVVGGLLFRSKSTAEEQTNEVFPTVVSDPTRSLNEGQLVWYGWYGWEFNVPSIMTRLQMKMENGDGKMEDGRFVFGSDHPPRRQQLQQSGVLYPFSLALRMNNE